MDVIDFERSGPDYLIKNSGAINIANQLTNTQRKCWNTMLFYAYPKLQDHEHFEEELRNIKHYAGYKNRNIEDFKKLITEMQGITIQGDLFNKVDEDWSSIQLLGDVAFTKEGRIRWNYSQVMRKFLASPKIYARLNMDVQRVISGKFTIPLWECFVDQLGARRQAALIKISIDMLRKLLPVNEGQYPAFKDFNRYVITPAVKEINNSSDILISDTRLIRSGRSVTRIDFKIERKSTNSHQIIHSTNTEIAAATECENFKDLLNRLRSSLDLSASQEEQIMKLIKDKEDPFIYLKDCYEYVREKSSKGEIKSFVSYFFGVLKKGYVKDKKHPSTIDIEKVAKEKIYMEKKEKATDNFIKLNEKEKSNIYSEFEKTLNSSMSIMYSTGGMEQGDKDLMRLFNAFLVKKFR
jgi:hypothetical protein